MNDFKNNAKAAEQAMRALFAPTPLQKNIYLSERYGADIWLKREDLSPVRSYKIRGAFNAMRKALAVDAHAGNSFAPVRAITHKAWPMSASILGLRV